MQQWSLVQLAENLTKGPAMFKTMERLIGGTADIGAAIFFDQTLLHDYLEDLDLVEDPTEEQTEKKLSNALKTQPYGGAIIDARDKLYELTGNEGEE